MQNLCHLQKSCCSSRDSTDGSGVSPNPLFQVTGIDFAGPFLMKKGHTRKPLIVYVCLFACLQKLPTLRVSKLTSEAFLACLKLFVVRRGLPSVIHSDNDSNFKGAKNDLYELFRFLQQDTTPLQVHAYLLSQRVEWKFSPARAPHFGVLWEAAVMSAKFHLKMVNVSQRLDFKKFSTIAAQVESCLNSRPLIQLNSHSKDGISALTPGHFLIGRPLHAYPETTITTSTCML